MKCGNFLVGWIIGESSPSKSVIIISDEGSKIARAGLYVAAEVDNECILGILEKIVSGNPLLPEEISDSKEVEILTSFPDLTKKLYKRGYVRWLSKLEPLASKGIIEAPRIPIDPSTPVYSVEDYYLKKIFGSEENSWIEIGSLVGQPDVRVGINVNKLSRHLAILAITGGGKSNTVCIISKNIVEKLGGTVVIFDIHGEYSKAEIASSRNQKVIEPRIHPLSLNLSELIRLMKIPSNATNQERILREAWHEVISNVKKSKSTPNNTIINLLKEKIRNMTDSKKRDKTKVDIKAVNGVLNRIDDLEENYRDIIDEHTHTNLINIIEPRKLNIFNLSSIDESGADAVVSHYLRRILHERKLWKNGERTNGYPSPVITVIEEAHVLIPKDSNTLTKYWASRIAREGRKFGIGLVLVSQRPKGLDPNVLSQTNNKIILRIVEPTDQKYVREASEQLSEDLLELLPDLNPGEAIVIGSMVKIPALVKIDYCKSLSTSADIDMVKEWEFLAQQTMSLDDIKNLVL